MPAATDDVRLVLAAGVRKPPREETAGEGLERYGLRFPMFLTQNFDDVCHRDLPRMPSVRTIVERSGPPADSFE